MYLSKVESFKRAAISLAEGNKAQLIIRIIKVIYELFKAISVNKK